MLLLSFIVGSILGSFGHLLASRTLLGENVTTKPSHCQNCRYRLKFYDLVPLISFLGLKGRCRQCKIKIPTSLFFSEIIMGALGSSAFFFGIPWWQITWFFLLYCLSLQDFWQEEIHSGLLFLGHSLVLGSYFLLGQPFHLETFSLALFLSLACYFFGKDKIGGGDILLLLFWSPMLHVKQWLFILIIACLFALPVAIAIKRVPFVPFLSLALFTVLMITNLFPNWSFFLGF